MRGLIKRTVLVIAIFIVPLYCLLNAHRGMAASATGTNLTTSPVSVDIAANPGTSTSTTFQVQNNAPDSVTINVKLKEFTANGDSGEAQIIDPQPGDPSPSWVHFSPSSFEAQPGVWNKVTMTIDVPKTAAYGYYYAVMFVPNTSVSSGTTSAKFKGANAIFVLLDTQSKGEKKQIGIKSFTVDSFVTQYLPVKFSVTVHNSGSIYAVPRGYIYISRTPDGPAIGTVDVNSSLGNVLPGTNRTFHVTWNDGFPSYQTKRVNGQIVSDSNGTPQQDLTWNFDQLTKFRFGNYFARLVVVYSDGTRDIESSAQASFWVIPWLFLGLFLVILAVLGLGVWSITRKILRSFKSVFKKRR